MNVYELAGRLPGPEELRERCRAVAVLEYVLGSGWSRYSYTRHWGDGEAAWMDDGSGDEWNIVFTGAGVFVRVLDHESAMSPWRDEDLQLWPGLVDGLPGAFADQLEEPAFCEEETGAFVATAVLWRLPGDDRWSCGRDIEFPSEQDPFGDSPDGTAELEILLDDPADRYTDFAEEHYDRPVDREAVAQVFARRPLSDSLVRELNPDADPGVVRREAAEIGYLA